MRREFGLSILVCTVLLGIGSAQSGAQQRPATDPFGTPQIGQKPGAPTRDVPGVGGRDSEKDEMVEKLEAQQMRTRNSERQRKLQADTQRLVSLAADLKQAMDKSDKNTLSVDVIRKAEEIEKLAKSVRERMRG